MERSKKLLVLQQKYLQCDRGYGSFLEAVEAESCWRRLEDADASLSMLHSIAIINCVIIHIQVWLQTSAGG